MAEIGVELVGATALAASLDQAAGAVDDLAQVNHDAGELVIGAADPPVRTGALKATVRAEVTPIGFALVAGSEAVDYAGAVHARDPFLTDALAAQLDEVVDRYTAHAQSAVDLIHGV